MVLRCGAFIHVCMEHMYMYSNISVYRRDVFQCIIVCNCEDRFVWACRWSGGEGEGGIARETFVNSLAKFSLLDTVKEMRPKSIECVRALLDIALEDGNFLAESWASVLRYTSQLARLQVYTRMITCFYITVKYIM